MWVISKTSKFDATSTFFARSVFYGPSGNDVEVSMEAKYRNSMALAINEAIFVGALNLGTFCGTIDFVSIIEGFERCPGVVYELDERVCYPAVQCHVRVHDAW